MEKDIFGNLYDWSDVLNQIEELRLSFSLDKHQPGLVRILRYPNNWKLRETVLDCIKELKRPDDSIIDVVLDIVMNDTVYYEQRILAADSLVQLCRKNEKARKKFVEEVGKLFDVPHPPAFHKALNRITRQIEDKETACSRACLEIAS